jgi:NAD(P)-dependent dehydrogenase (short-subunit alcohol dehydrogenase family)
MERSVVAVVEEADATGATTIGGCGPLQKSSQRQRDRTRLPDPTTPSPPGRCCTAGAIRSRIPASGWGNPSDVAGAAVHLAFPASDDIRGGVITVVGGWICGDGAIGQLCSEHVKGLRR